MQVEFPFGMGNRRMKGYVVGFSREPDYPLDKIKELTGIVEGSVKAEAQLIALAAWMRERYGSTMNQALKTVLPVKQKTRQRQSRRMVRKISREEGEMLLQEYQRKKYRAKARLLEALLQDEMLDYQKTLERLKLSASVISGFEKNGIIEIKSETIYRNPFAERRVNKKQEITLSKEQKQAVEGIWGDYRQGIRRTYLLHGVTGSGKTEVYMELIARVIDDGKQAVVLIPEIALTFQTVMRFHERFGERVSVMHSRLSDGERYDQFLRAKDGEIDVIIGPRDRKSVV